MEKAKLKMEERLITKVFDYPQLYCKTSESYHDKILCENTWQKIAEELETEDAKGVKSLWTSLKTQHSAYLRKLDNPTGSARGNPPYFRHSKAMAFMKDNYNSRKRFTNFKPKTKEIPPTSTDGEKTDGTNETGGENSGTMTCDEDVDNYLTHGILPELQGSSRSQNAPKGQNTTQQDSSESIAALLAKEAEKEKRKRRRGADDFDDRLLSTLEGLSSTSQNQDEAYYFVMSIVPAMRRIAKASSLEFMKLKLNFQNQILESEQSILNNN